MRLCISLLLLKIVDLFRTAQSLNSMASAEREPITAVWGQSLHGGSGGEAPLKLNSLFVFACLKEAANLPRHRYLVRDKKSLEFTVTRSLMKLFKTGSVAVVSECQFFRFCPSRTKLISALPSFWKNSWLVIIISVDYSSVMLKLAWTKFSQCTIMPAQL